MRIPFRRRYRLALSFIEYMTTLPYRELFGLWVAMVLGFGAVYVVLSSVAPAHGLPALGDMEPARRLFNGIYFSAITATTVGYGDIVPVGVAKFLAAVQGALGLFSAGIFVSKLVSHRQEITLTQVHKLSFENVFHKTREGFYITRRDIDGIAHRLQAHGDVSEKGWENLSIACHACETFIEEIPHFYSADRELYTLDEKRERLLQDAFFRTLRHLRELLAAFDAAGIDWRSRRETRSEVEELTETAANVLPVWRSRSPYGGAAGFERIEDELSQLRAAAQARA